MEKVQLITYRNRYLRTPLLKAGYSPIEYALPFSNNEIQEIEENSFHGYKIIEVNDENIENSSVLIDAVNRTGKVICITGKISDRLKKLLLEKGISDVILSGDIERLNSFLKVLKNEENNTSGKMLILENNNSIKKILDSILIRFGYKPVFVDSVDGMFGELNQIGIQFILINLGLQNLDLNELIRRSYSHSEIKKIPLISYKDMTKGLFIHEITSGLNRLTKVILSPDELYSFLVSLLFRKKIIPVVEIINRSVNFERLAHYSKKTLSQIYNSDKDNILSLNNHFNKDNIDEILQMNTRLENFIIKTYGLRWLIIDNYDTDANNSLESYPFTERDS